MELQNRRIAEWYKLDGVEIQNWERIYALNVQERGSEEEIRDFSDEHNC